MLQKLKENFEKLVALYEAEKEKNEALSRSLAESQAACKAYGEQIVELEKKIEHLKLTAAFVPSGDQPREAREKVDRLIREIDKCISLLEK
ncbi:MAG: hypothetical protein J6Y27_06335 [Bacteroidales bacterium]|nr:hypothetical protein [Bacteroidales bacterium]MBP5389945.1 hypothetical protein [Bacteroidales bacterium]MBP5634985.1 hypothetical protein [Bacteroidales bacterium]